MQTLKFRLPVCSDLTKLVIVKGLVVPEGTIVEHGLEEKKSPSLESCIADFKLLFGIKRLKKIVAEEEEEEAQLEKSSDEGSDDQSCFSEIEEEEEKAEDSD